MQCCLPLVDGRHRRIRMLHPVQASLCLTYFSKNKLINKSKRFFIAQIYKNPFVIVIVNIKSIDKSDKSTVINDNVYFDRNL